MWFGIFILGGILVNYDDFWANQHGTAPHYGVWIIFFPCTLWVVCLCVIHSIWFDFTHNFRAIKHFDVEIVMSLRLFIVRKSLIFQMKTFRIWFHIWHWAIQHKKWATHNTVPFKTKSQHSTLIYALLSHWQLSLIHSQFCVREYSFGMCLVSQAAVSTLEFGNAALVSFFYHEKCKSLSTWMNHTHTLKLRANRFNSNLKWIELYMRIIWIGRMCSYLIDFLRWKFFNGQTLFHTSNKWFAKLYLREHSWKKNTRKRSFCFIVVYNIGCWYTFYISFLNVHNQMFNNNNNNNNFFCYIFINKIENMSISKEKGKLNTVK